MSDAWVLGQRALREGWRTPDGANAIAPVIRALDEAGVEVESVEVESPTLDDVFLDATGRTRDRIEGAVQEVGA